MGFFSLSGWTYFETPLYMKSQKDRRSLEAYIYKLVYDIYSYTFYVWYQYDMLSIHEFHCFNFEHPWLEATPIEEYPQRRLPWQWMGPEAVKLRRPSRDSFVTESWGCNDVVLWCFVNMNDWQIGSNWCIYIYIYTYVMYYIMFCIGFVIHHTLCTLYMNTKYVSNKTNIYVYIYMSNEAYSILYCYMLLYTCEMFIFCFAVTCKVSSF